MKLLLIFFVVKVLCFQAYFQEAVHEKREEQYRIRRCKVYFYLEDDSIQVNEPQVIGLTLLTCCFFFQYIFYFYMPQRCRDLC